MYEIHLNMHRPSAFYMRLWNETAFGKQVFYTLINILINLKNIQ